MGATRAPLLISRCLLGERVRYDGGACASSDPRIEAWRAQGRLVPVCPEVDGGLDVPRPPAELVGGRALTRAGIDVTAGYDAGAQNALREARARGARVALLKQRSPSCGSREIYDGSFSGRLVPGRGIAAALLEEHGVRVFGEDELDALEQRLVELDASLGVSNGA